MLKVLKNVSIIYLRVIFIVASEIREKADSMDEVKFKGYCRIPTKHLTICCRRSPCGEGISHFSILLLKVQIHMIVGKWKFIKEYLEFIVRKNK